MLKGTIALLAFLAAGAVAQEVECWAPDGQTLADNETYVPCNKLGITQDGVHSSCCNLDGEPGERDLCTSTGLCLQGSVLKRGYCTDRDWKNPACVAVCTDDDDDGSENGTVEITPCGDGSTFCCGRNNNRCCDTDKAFTIPSLVLTDDDNIASSSSSSTTTRNAAIGLGAALGVVLLTSAVLLFLLWKKNKSLTTQLGEAQAAQQQMAENNNNLSPSGRSAHPYHESYISTVGGEGTVASSSPGMQHAFYHKSPPLSPVPGTLSEVEGHRYTELDATNTYGGAVGGFASPTREEHEQGTVVPDSRATSPRVGGYTS